jgi:hypothetical protein
MTNHIVSKYDRNKLLPPVAELDNKSWAGQAIGTQKKVKHTTSLHISHYYLFLILEVASSPLFTWKFIISCTGIQSIEDLTTNMLSHTMSLILWLLPNLLRAQSRISFQELDAFKGNRLMCPKYIVSCCSNSRKEK